MRHLAALLVAGGALLASATPAAAANGVQRLHYAAGPYLVRPGANSILTDYRDVPKPTVNGFMVRVAPNLHYALPNGKCCGAIPRVDVIHLHHGVWLTNGPAGAGEGNGYCQRSFCLYEFMASGEEKTVYKFPRGYGYPIGGNDHWFLNYMIHNLRERPRKVYITYDLDFIPDSSPAARGITPLHPIWMDVMDRHIYPVFDVHRHTGRKGKFTFPDMANRPYGNGPPLNLFTVDHPGTLIATAGHVHPGGLYDELDLIRPGARVAARRAIKGPVPNSVRLFRSHAHYFDPRGPISWDMAMTATSPKWRPRANTGDTLRISSTYETRRASWYESMGIMIVWEAWDNQHGVDPFTGKLAPPLANASGADPFTYAVAQHGHVTHGHLHENRHHGGTHWLTVNPRKLRSCHTHTVTIGGFTYRPGDLEAPGRRRCAPTIRKGQSLTFRNEDASPLAPGIPGLAPSPAYINSIFHTITACQNPCGLDTGISYPLANGRAGYDSGQLGIGTPAVGRVTWSTPTSLAPGTYTFFCRIHPFMRGVFRIRR
jgi:hypothetical protein